MSGVQGQGVDSLKAKVSILPPHRAKLLLFGLLLVSFIETVILRSFGSLGRFREKPERGRSSGKK